MNIKITGKDLKATDAIKDYIGKKLERIEKYFDDELDVTATIRVKKSLTSKTLLAKKRIQTHPNYTSTHV